jgi:hypothetical protein
MASLFKSQQNRAEEKRDKNDRITRPGYELPFDREQFVAWFLGKLGGNEGSAIRCLYCSQPIDAYSCAIDHAIPLKRGGSPELSNLDVVCEGCNFAKGQMTVEEFVFFRQSLIAMFVKFPDGKAVRDITSRLQKAVQLAAGMRWNRAKAAKHKRKSQEPVAVEGDW